MPDANPTLYLFKPDAGIPNSRLPLAFWRGRLPVQYRSGERAMALYRSNGWRGTWVYTVFPYWHFHTRGHEALACVSGTARVGFGGDGGIQVDVEIGDVCVIPAGVGHRRLASSSDFQMAGSYPLGQEGDIVRPGEMDDAAVAKAIAALPLPQTDPISGQSDGVVEAWHHASQPQPQLRGN